MPRYFVHGVRSVSFTVIVDVEEGEDPLSVPEEVYGDQVDEAISHVETVLQDYEPVAEGDPAMDVEL